MFNVCTKAAWLFQARNYCAPWCSNVKSKILCQVFLFQARNCYLWHLMSRVITVRHMTVWHDDPLVTAIQLWCSLTVTSAVCILGAMMHCSANIHVNCMQPIFHVTISTSFCPFGGSALSWLAALLTSMFAESFYVLSSLCFASSLELTILGWHYFAGSDPVSRINDRSFYLIPLLQKNNASWGQWR